MEGRASDVESLEEVRKICSRSGPGAEDDCWGRLLDRFVVVGCRELSGRLFGFGRWTFLRSSDRFRWSTSEMESGFRRVAEEVEKI